MTVATLDHTGTLTARVHRILAAHPEGLTDDRLWQLTGESHRRHGSVVKRRAEVGAVPSGRFGKSMCGRKATIWRLP